MSKFKIILITSLTVCLLAAVYFIIKRPTQSHMQAKKVVAVTQIVRHPSLDAVRRGIEDSLKELNVQIIYEDAQGNVATAAQIAQKFVGMKPDVMVAITTPSAQTMFRANQTEQIPMVFTSVSDPKGAGLVDDMNKHAGFLTGIADMAPVEAQLNFIEKIEPMPKRIGVVYTPSEVNSMLQIELLKQHAYGRFEIITVAAPKTSEVKSATLSLVDRVDAIYIPNDNGVVSALDSLIAVANKNMIPVFASDPESVSRGVTAAVAYNQYEVGVQTGKLVAKVLAGTKPGDIPIVSAEKYETKVNAESARLIRVKLP